MDVKLRRPSMVEDVSMLDGSSDDIARLARLARWRTPDWIALLQEAPVVSWATASRFGVSRSKLVVGLSAAYDRYREADPTVLGMTPRAQRTVFGNLGLLLLTVHLLEQVETTQSPSSNHGSDRCGDHGLARRLISDENVRTALRDAYRPAERDALRTWDAIDFASLEFHRVGTTSFILKGHSTRTDGRASDPLALKCLFFPYTTKAQVADPSRDYAHHYQLRDGARPKHVVRIWASCEKWIAMDFVDGPTLAEWLERSRPAPQARRPAWLWHLAAWLRLFRRPTAEPLRLGDLEQVGGELFDALNELRDGALWQTAAAPHDAATGDLFGGRAHLDLSPSNVILEPSRIANSGHVVKLIDLGRNHLYARSIGALEGAGARFVAPEIKDADVDLRHTNLALADVYSLGQILIEIGGLKHGGATPIPDGFYERTPMLARFLEDLVDTSPGRRLLIFQSADGWTFAQLGEAFERELTAVRKAEGHSAAPTDGRVISATREMLTLGLEWAWRLGKLWWDRRHESGLGRVSRYLLVWSVICAIAWALTSLIVAAQFLRDIGIQNLPTPVQIALLFVPRGVSGQAAATLQHLNQPSGLSWNSYENLSARIVGFSFALVGVKFYQNILSTLTPRLGVEELVWYRRLPSLALESLMRLFAFWWSILIVLPNVYISTLWPITTAIGITGLTLLHAVCNAFAARTLRRARGQLSTVPAEGDKISGLENYRQWTATSLVYAVIIWTIGILLLRGTVRDALVYGSTVSAVNITILYLVKCGTNAPSVRGGLARIFLAAERLRRLEGRAARERAMTAVEIAERVIT